MKNLTILKKFIGITVIVTLVVLFISFLILNFQKNNLEENVLKQTVKSLKSNTNVELKNKFDVGISNAVSIGNNSAIKEALRTNNRDIAINAVKNLSSEMKNNTQFQNTKVHIIQKTINLF